MPRELDRGSSSLSQRDTPYLDALARYALDGYTAFHCPGHNRGEGVHDKLKAYLGESVFKFEVNEVPEIDSYQTPTGPLREALKLAAEAYGADYAYFLLGGSTLGNLVMIFSTVTDNEKIIIPRNAHKSVINAVIFSGATPVFVQPVYDYELQIDHTVTPHAYREAILRNPDVKAILVISPTYYGVAADLKAVVKLARTYGKLVLVDQAWGPHFAFSEKLPLCGVRAGADIVVTSVHKILTSFTGTSLLLLKGNRVDRVRVEKVLMALASTSPNSLLLASLDVARMQMATEGERIIDNMISLAETLREKLRALGIRVIGREIVGKPGVYDYDLTRVVFSLQDYGYTGHEINEILARDYRIQVEMSDMFNLVLLITPGTKLRDIYKLVEAIEDILLRHERGELRPKSLLRWITELPDWPPIRMSPRTAFISPQEAVPLDESVGRISAELITPYPPGIPIIIPGEEITEDVINYLKLEIRAGGKITGMADPTFQTIRVVKE